MYVLNTRLTFLFWTQKKIYPVWILLYLITSQCYAYDMESYCDKEISMTRESMYQVELELDDEYIYDRHQFFSNRRKSECETTVSAWYSTYNKIMFYIENLDLRCDEGHLEFNVGRESYMRVPGLERDLCGESKPTQVFTVNDRYMRIKYVSKKPQSKHDVFSIIMTSYSDGTCQSKSFICDNSRCIDRDIACNDYDSCGDGSGCTQQSTSVIIGATVGSLIVVGIIVTVVVWFVYCKRKQRKTPSNSQGMCICFTPTQKGDAQQACNQENYETLQGLPTSHSEVAGRKEVNDTDSEKGSDQEHVYRII